MENLLVSLALIARLAFCSGFTLDFQPLYQSSLEDLRADWEAQRNAKSAPPPVMPLRDRLGRGLAELLAREADAEEVRLDRSAASFEEGVSQALSGIPPRTKHRRQKKDDGEGEDEDEDEEDEEETEEVPENVVPGGSGAGDKDPFWHHPCGRSVDFVVRRPKGASSRHSRRILSRSLEKVWRQLNMSVLHFQLQNFDKLYYRILIGVDEDQYIPNWIPGKADIPLLHSADIQSNEKLAEQLTTLHTQLQKFSVVLEHIAEDSEDDIQRQAALKRTRNYVKMLLCEVEWALLSLAIPVPGRLSREIMLASERNTPDNTNRDVRNWGVLLRYRDFLHGWSDIVARAANAQGV